MISDDSVSIEREIEYLEIKIRKRNESIKLMKRRMAQYQRKIRYERAANTVPLYQQEQLTSQLKQYRKLIHLPSDSPKTYLEQTEEVFQNQDEKLRNLEEQIEQLEQTIEAVREKVPPVKDILAEMRIEVPNFKAIVDQNFKDWLNSANGLFNKKLLSAFTSKTFKKKEIQSKTNQKNKLLRELKALSPMQRKIQLETPTKSQFKNRPKPEFSKFSSYNSMILNKLYNNAKTAMQNYKSTIDIDPQPQPEAINSFQLDQSKVIAPVARARRKARGNNSARSSMNRTSVRLDRTTSPHGRRQRFNSANLSGTQPLEMTQNASIAPASLLSILANTQPINHSKMFELNKSISKLNEKIQSLTKISQHFACVKQQVESCLEDQKVAISFKNCCSNSSIQQAKEKFKQTKKRVNDEKEELDSLLLDIPPQWRGSAEGLLKWQELLLNNQKNIREELKKQITNETTQLSNLKVITRRRINTLRRTKNQPGPILEPLPNKT